MSWRPLLQGALREQALDFARAIGRALLALPAAGPDLAAGASGRAIAHAYLHQAFPDDGHADAAVASWEFAQEAIAEATLGLGLYSGIAGVAFATEHLRARLLELDADAVAEVDELILECLARSPFPGPYDLISGLVGLGAYALERQSAAMIDAVWARLDELAGGHFHTPPELLPEHQRAMAPSGYYNLGLAHGVPGVIALAAACGRTGPLLDQAVTWLLAQEQADPPGSRFCFWIPGEAGAGPAQVAWCYGDGGVASALLAAGAAAGRRDWTEHALGLLHRIERLPPADCKLVDAAICHGTGGLAHILNRCHQNSGDARLGALATSWYARTVALRSEPGIGGFRAWDGKTWKDDDGLLTGAAGVALVLCAAATDVAPDWDRMLLV